MVTTVIILNSQPINKVEEYQDKFTKISYEPK